MGNHTLKYSPHQYKGFLNTPFLWKESFEHIKQLEIDLSPNSELLVKKNEIHSPLGKVVEQFVFNQFSLESAIEILTKNLQIQNNKITIGEIDCVIRHLSQVYHVEIVYKFYLYDPSIKGDETEKWIGPNRNDSFYKKVKKLKEKQLPLLHTPITLKKLNSLNINTSSIKQRVYFKAQLFLPLNFKLDNVNSINKECIQGFYINLKELNQLKDCKFFIPIKPDWLCIPRSDVNWLKYDVAKKKLQQLLTHPKSTLCWIKSKNGVIKKCFVVWW